MEDPRKREGTMLVEQKLTAKYGVLVQNENYLRSNRQGRIGDKTMKAGNFYSL